MILKSVKILTFEPMVHVDKGYLKATQEISGLPILQHFFSFAQCCRVLTYIFALNCDVSVPRLIKDNNEDGDPERYPVCDS